MSHQSSEAPRHPKDELADADARRDFALIRSHWCPDCGAEPGSLCIRPSDGGPMRSWTHVGRTRLVFPLRRSA